MLFSISSAARAAGKNRATISRHIKEGRLSATRDAVGNVAIDQAELIRVYGELKKPDEPKDAKNAKNAEIERLRFELRRMEEAVRGFEERERASAEREKTAREREEWMKREIEDWKRQALLPPSKTDAAFREADLKRPGFLSRLFGRRQEK